MTNESRTTRRDWVGVVTVALSVFVVTTTEMMPVGVLPGIAADFGVSEGVAGLGVSLFGLVAGLSAPVATVLTGRLDRRMLLLVILGVFTLGNIAVGLAPNFGVYVAARFGTGVAHGLMWSIVAGIAIRLVDRRDAVRATSAVFAGISVALVLGVPMGSMLGAVFGWRAAFVMLAGASAGCLLLVSLLLPRMPASGSLRWPEFVPLLRSRLLVAALSLTAVVVIGNYAAYTYVVPFLTQERGVGPLLLGPVLLAYGIAGVVGNFASGAVMTRTGSIRLVLVAFTAVMTGALFALLVPAPLAVVIALLIAWGAAYSGIPVALQTLVLRAGARNGEAATSIYVLIFNCSIAVGAVVGGATIDRWGPSAPIVTGAVLGVVACGVALMIDRRRKSAPDSHQLEVAVAESSAP